jgi:hypothetical protein
VAYLIEMALIVLVLVVIVEIIDIVVHDLVLERLSGEVVDRAGDDLAFVGEHSGKCRNGVERRRTFSLRSSPIW